MEKLVPQVKKNGSKIQTYNVRTILFSLKYKTWEKSEVTG